MSSVSVARPAYHIEPSVRRQSSFGVVFQARRQHYVLHIPLCLFLGAILTWVLPNEPMMVIACSIGSLTGLYLGFDWLLRGGPLRFSTVLAMAMLLGYCLGTMNTWLTESRASLTLAQMYSLDPASLARAASSVLLTCGILIALGELYERPVFGKEFRLEVNGRMLSFIYAGTAAIVLGYLTKRLTLGGAGGSSGGEVSPINAFLLWLFFPLVAIAVSAFLALPAGLKKTLMGFTSALLMILIMTQGRRNQIYTAFLVVFATQFSGYKLRGGLLKKAFYLGILMCVVAAGTLSYQLLRSLGRFGGADAIPLLPRVERAATMVEEGTAFSTALSLSRENVTRRTFILIYYADLLEASSHITPAYGGDLGSQVEQIVPHALFPSKTVVEEEVIASRQFGTDPRDQPNSLLTGGAIDFGLIGVIVYPLMMVYFMRKFVDIVMRYLPVFPAVFIVLTLVFVSMQAEGLASTYLIVIRNDILFSVVLLLFYSLPAFRLRSPA